MRPALPRRFWTADEIATLRELYPHATAREVGARLGRTAKAIHQAAKLHGLATQRRAVVDDKFLADVRRLNGEGWPDTDIAAHLGCERHTVSNRRRAMGLPSREKGEKWRERIAYKSALQCRAAGVDSLGAYRSLVFRRRSAAAGWPADLRPRHVDILDALGSRGPMTRPEIAEAIGMRWLGTRASLKSNDPEGSYLAHLVRRGLVADLGRVATGKGRGSSRRLYALAPTAGRRTS